MKTPLQKNFNPLLRIMMAAIILASTLLASCQGESIIRSVFPKSEDELLPQKTAEPVTWDDNRMPTVTTVTVRDLIIWVPPQFDPSGEDASAQLFNKRLKEYQRENPHVNLIVRVKALSGPSGLLETLTSASAVAPASTPTLILLTRADMIQAITKNLLSPMDEFTTVIDEEDWYTFAQSMAIQQGSIYGLPYASNLLGIVYRQSVLENDQPDWNEVFRRFNQLAFPAGDPEALIPLSLYLSAGGELRDLPGQPVMNLDILTQVLSIFAEGSRRGVIPSTLIELQNDDQAWEYFQNEESDAVITWVSRAFNTNELHWLAMIPSLGEQSYTTASGWLWCLSARDEISRREGVKLAEFLVAPEFLAEWSPASGFLPVRPSSLSGWSGFPQKNTISRMLQSAQPRPIRQLTTAISAELKTSIAEVLTRQSTPAESAQKLIDRLEAIDVQ